MAGRFIRASFVLLLVATGCVRQVPRATGHDEPPATPVVARAPKPVVVGVASYYGSRFQGRRTANGERFNMHALTAAHRTLPFGTCLHVVNADNGRSVRVRVNDRGPYAGERVLDLSAGAARVLGMLDRGVVPVRAWLCGSRNGAR